MWSTCSVINNWLMAKTQSTSNSTTLETNSGLCRFHSIHEATCLLSYKLFPDSLSHLSYGCKAMFFILSCYLFMVVEKCLSDSAFKLPWTTIPGLAIVYNYELKSHVLPHPTQIPMVILPTRHWLAYTIPCLSWVVLRKGPRTRMLHLPINWQQHH